MAPNQLGANWSTDIIRSPSNPVVKRVRSLQRRSRRYTERVFVVEGRVGIEDGIEAGGTIQTLILREGSESLLAAMAMASGVPVRRVESQLFDALSELETSPGIMAIFSMPSVDRHIGATPLVLVVDEVRDPGNLGTILRTAAAAGVTELFVTRGTVDPYHPRAVRAGMGAHFRLSIGPATTNSLTELGSRIEQRVFADAHAATLYDTHDWTTPTVLIIGSESRGVSSELRRCATSGIAIPLAKGMESLNAAMATAVILFEAARQRRGQRSNYVERP